VKTIFLTIIGSRTDSFLASVGIDGNDESSKSSKSNTESPSSSFFY